MKEERFFYQPDIESGELTKDDVQHAVRVLRMLAGDQIWLMDGKGTFYEAEITAASNHRCAYRIVKEMPQRPTWQGHLHLAVAPTKLNDRIEWLAEKATEIGFDELSFLDCQFSERHVIKTERIEKIVISAMKQSRKAWRTQVNEMLDFSSFVKQQHGGQRFICHCYEGDKPYLLDVLQPGEDATVLIGPEGDFSVSEVRLAESLGYQPVSLGESRLRTETAALVAVHMMQIAASKAIKDK